MVKDVRKKKETLRVGETRGNFEGEIYWRERKKATQGISEKKILEKRARCCLFNFQVLPFELQIKLLY